MTNYPRRGIEDGRDAHTYNRLPHERARTLERNLKGMKKQWSPNQKEKEKKTFKIEYVF